MELGPSAGMDDDGAASFGLFELGSDGKYSLVDVPWEQIPFTRPQEKSGPLEQPVVLYVHGWQSGAIKSRSSRGDGFVTNMKVYGEERNVALPWIEAGYRVLCFLWVAFADEADVATAERKIWSSGPEQVQRRRRHDGSYEELRGVGDLGSSLMEVYCRSLVGAPRIHLVGHSLGCQMVARLLEQLLDEPVKVPLPQRVTLLDPYFTNFGKPYLNGRWTGERVREVVRRAAEAGCAIEHVASSAVLENPLSDANVELRFHTAYFLLRPEFMKFAFGPRDTEVLRDRHAYARFAYFASFSGSPSGATRDATSAAGLADRSDPEVRKMMTSEFHWVQVEGQDRWDPSRLTFEQRIGSGTSVRPPAPVFYA